MDGVNNNRKSTIECELKLRRVLNHYSFYHMKIEYYNLYNHLILITQNRSRSITELNRGRIEKYMTGVINNNQSKLYSIYANPEHVHMMISRSPKISEEVLATIISDSTARFIN